MRRLNISTQLGAVICKGPAMEPYGASEHSEITYADVSAWARWNGKGGRAKRRFVRQLLERAQDPQDGNFVGCGFCTWRFGCHWLQHVSNSTSKYCNK